MLATVIDGHPATLSWMGAVRGQRIAPLGVDRFGQSGDIPDLYGYYGLDAEAIAAAVERTLRRPALGILGPGHGIAGLLCISPA